MWVRVYKNIPKGCLSIQNTEGVVVEHTEPPVYLKEAEFRVQPAGRDRVREEEVKNVHAKVHGHLLEEQPLEDSLDCPVRYNPYKFDQFVFEDNEEPIYHASHARVELDRVFVHPVEKSVEQEPFS